MKEIDLDKIKKFPWELMQVKKQTYEMCVEFNEPNLTKEQIYNLRIIAVNQNRFALQYVRF
ncbi:TPA: hypothetical protein UL242_002549 [Clostridioides difficile]|nr:hypothetical protein [Clostridioides difficile]HEL2860441.1 hypothetical protein [Clostridioides difficile]